MSKTAHPPKYFRSNVATGSTSEVYRDGGMFSAGMIESVSVITGGEALGHDLWIDEFFLEQVATDLASASVKSRFTHPGLSSDGVGQKLGVVTGGCLVGNQVIANLHLQEASTKTPDGDLADYVMTLAEETPGDFGLSIVFDHDIDAMDTHTANNTFNGRFVSPDEMNKDNLPHARLLSLSATDVVDSPAANPSGLFQRGQEIAQEGSELLEYALGLSDEKPESSCFDMDGDRLAAFVSRFLKSHDLQIQKGNAVSDTNTEAVVEEPAVQTPEQTRENFAQELNQYIEMFGAEFGANLFAEGVSLSDAKERLIVQLQSEKSALEAKVNDLQEALQSIDRGDDDGAGFEGNDDLVDEGPKTFANRIKIANKASNNGIHN